jgi:uncharacterized protein YjbI with pentapeptide repeats
MSSPQLRQPGSFHALSAELAAAAFPDASPMTTASYALQVVAAVGRAQNRRLPLQASPELPGADLSRADLAGLTLSRAILTDADLTGADLTGADLTGAILINANLREAILTGACVTLADLTGANLGGANLGGARLGGARLGGADLRGAVLTETVLIGAILARTDLIRADLTGADLTRADLTGALLTGADLTGADLTRADLTGALLTGADLTGADLTGADLTRTDLTGVLWSGETSWPEDMASLMRNRSEELRPTVLRVAGSGGTGSGGDSPGSMPSSGTSSARTTGAVLTRELLEAIEVNAASTGNHKRAAVRMSRLAVQATASGMSRAEAHMRAGEQWLLADEPTEAVEQFRKAIADGGPTFDDPRVSLARAMFALGRTDDAEALLREVRESGARTIPRTCDLVAELLTEQGNLEGALDWATAGVDACLAGEDRDELELLLRLRYRLRVDLGLPEDDYDKLLTDPSRFRE